MVVVVVDVAASAVGGAGLVVATHWGDVAIAHDLHLTDCLSIKANDVALGLNRFVGRLARGRLVAGLEWTRLDW